MTDNEIIKALGKLYDEAHKGYMANLEHNGPRDTSHEEYIDLMSATLELIQRQQERIERLKDNLDAVLKERTDHTEAIKDFADRVVGQLKESSKTYCEEYGQRENTLYLWDAIDIVKEMVGGSDDR